MARPEKSKRICNVPKNNMFVCEGSDPSDQFIELSVEEYETIRLLDHIGLNQEQCAEQMKVARTTVQRLYTNARHKIADHLVSGTRMVICGGNYKVCENSQFCCQQFDCEFRQCGCSCKLQKKPDDCQIRQLSGQLS